MRKIPGFIMNRVEKYPYSNGDTDNALTYITLLCSDGIIETYATGNVVEEIVNQYHKGSRIECQIENSNEIIFGKQINGRIVAT
ncbi:hypothetical protein [Erysipelothrix anatis]|uniref:hypothetical protein n=1 Tax=Erysipelothrix anatis TaxID=2683713 RepID=UPI00135CBF7F|nr:hypothetical protein [Erysipelothrix anatis]